MVVSLQTLVEIGFRPIFGIALTKIKNPNNIALFGIAACMLSVSLFLNSLISGSWSLLIFFTVIQGIAFAFCGGLPTGLVKYIQPLVIYLLQPLFASWYHGKNWQQDSLYLQLQLTHHFLLGLISIQD